MKSVFTGTPSSSIDCFCILRALLFEQDSCGFCREPQNISALIGHPLPNYGVKHVESASRAWSSRIGLSSLFVLQEVECRSTHGFGGQASTSQGSCRGKRRSENRGLFRQPNWNCRRILQNSVPGGQEAWIPNEVYRPREIRPDEAQRFYLHLPRSHVWGGRSHRQCAVIPPMAGRQRRGGCPRGHAVRRLRPRQHAV